MTHAKKNTRRRYGAELKQQILAKCAEPGASVASTATRRCRNMTKAMHSVIPRGHDRPHGECLAT